MAPALYHGRPPFRALSLLYLKTSIRPPTTCMTSATLTIAGEPAISAQVWALTTAVPSTPLLRSGGLRLFPATLSLAAKLLFHQISKSPADLFPILSLPTHSRET